MERNGGKNIRAREGQLEVKTCVKWLGDPRSQQVIGKMAKGKATLINYFIHSFIHL